MSTISLRLPESLHKKIKDLVSRDGTSINQFVNSAVAEKISAFLTKDYLDERAAKGSRKKFFKALSKVKNKKAEPGDDVV